MPGTPIYWSQEPVEWSPLAPSGAGNIPAHAADYLYQQPALVQMPEQEQELPAEQEQYRKKGKWLPIVVLILLLLGLLAALLSSFLLPPSSSHGTSMRAVPAVMAGQSVQTQRGA